MYYLKFTRCAIFVIYGRRVEVELPDKVRGAARKQDHTLSAKNHIMCTL